MRVITAIRCLAGLLIVGTLTASAGELPRNESAADLRPKGATYWRSDGSINIVGSAGLRELLTEFNQRFARTHPGISFTLHLDPSGATGLGGLAAGVSAFAPMDRAAWPQETRPFRQVYGYEVTDICIGRQGYAPATGLGPPVLCINARNPLAGLTVGQATRIFTRGSDEGDLTHWSQLGLTGDWGERVIHLYGPRDNGGFVSALRHSRMGGWPLSRRYEPLATTAGILQAVVDDPYAIGLIGVHEAAALPNGVRLLPLAAIAHTPFRMADGADLAAGRYPWGDFVHLYINLAPGQPLDPLVRDYLRLVLSPEGQALIAAAGHVPLTAPEVGGELAKFERAKPSP
ncbi:MAG: substrate-binding domain-containing protein [Opitutaceae bacterium]